MELCLAHTVGNAVERAYARSDLMDKRRALIARATSHEILVYSPAKFTVQQITLS